MVSIQELLILIVIVTLLSSTGLWPRIIRGLRELRGEHVEHVDETRPPASSLELGYKMLGVSPSASWEEIERAYRAKAKVHHPDRGGDEDAMRALNDVYAQLKRMRGR